MTHGVLTTQWLVMEDRLGAEEIAVGMVMMMYKEAPEDWVTGIRTNTYN